MQRISPHRFYRIALIASAGSLAAVFILQYGFGLHPCELCLWERIPYAVALLVAVTAMMAAKERHTFMLGLLALVFLASTALGTYHAGVEKKIFAGPGACTSQPAAAGMTVEQLRERIMAAPVSACDQPQWEWRSITLAGLNAAWSALLFVFFARAFLQRRTHE